MSFRNLETWSDLGTSMSSSFAIPRTESTHHRLYEFAKLALIKIFVHPYATVCDLYCGGGVDAEKWDGAQIGHYIGIDVSSSGVSEMREAWESQRKIYTAEFFEADPCTENFGVQLQEKANQADLVCCLQNLQLCFENEENARKLLHNVSSLLKPGGYFFGITPDSSTIWAKYQKNVEAYHNRSGSMKPNIVPNCIRSESYMITFEVEEEKFPLFGKKYQLKFAHDPANSLLVHFPSLIRLAREAGLEYVEIQNLTEFYDDNRMHFASMLLNAGPNLVDPRGRLLPRSFDVLGLYTTFIFQKPDPDVPHLLQPHYCRTTVSIMMRQVFVILSKAMMRALSCCADCSMVASSTWPSLLCFNVLASRTPFHSATICF
ncbi:hypothetical protein GH714_007131 [Hevea brasiliensis]|uniref:mRNA cap guanine-N(7) methyltransferase 2 n=1 Tax=Hevea brasiliensis TaxID=3981 RepID=A0A6A6MZA5_HEVBR|nr:hypothetical protein GH714_007131 [Hevea brasiliensis]